MREWHDEIRSRLASLRLDTAREADIVEELAQHLDERFNEVRQQGRMSDEEARRLALNELLAPDALADAMRSLRQTRAVPSEPPRVRTHSWVDPLLQDGRFALRNLLRRSSFVGVVLATLTLGIGANVAVFSLVDGLLLRPLPFGDRSERVVTLHSTFGQQVRALGDVSYLDLLDLEDRLRSFEGVAGLVRRNFTVTTNSDADRLLGYYVTPELFGVLGVAPMMGRHFSFEDAAPPGFETTVMLTYGLWQRRFGGDVSIVGRAVTINDRPHTVVGVMPPRFRFPDRAELYLPLRLNLREVARSARNFAAVGVLKPGVTVEAAQADVSDVAARLSQEYPATNRGYGIRVLAFRDSQVPRDARAIATALMGSVVFLLLIVCANLGTLFLLRNAARRRELAIRSAIGATPRRLTVLVLSEVLFLTVAGAILGAAAAAWGIHLVRVSWADQLPYWVQLAPDHRMLLFVVAASAATAIAIASFGVVGATRVTLAGALAENEARATSSRRTQRARTSLAAAQIALSLALLVGANLMIGSFMALQRADLGFSFDQLVTARVNLSGDVFDPNRARAAYVDAAVNAIRSATGVTAAAATSTIPGVDVGDTVRLVTDEVSVDDHTEAQTVTVTSQFADVLGLAVRDGRTFTASESSDPDAAVAMLNETLAARLWKGESAVGKRVGLQGERVVRWMRIVGVMPDVGYGNVGRATEPTQLHLYLPYARFAPRAMAFLARASGDPAAVREQVRAALRQVHTGIPVYDVKTMKENREEAGFDQQWLGTLMGAFAAMSLFLASLGVYGLIADSARQREREVGVRLVLGAQPRTIVWLFVSQAQRIGLGGAAVGLALAFAVARTLRGNVYGVRALDPLMFLGATALLLSVVALAAFLPARRASHTDPVVSLRQN